MKIKHYVTIAALTLLCAASSYAKGSKEKLSTPVYEESGDSIAVEIKTVGTAAAVQGSTVIAGQDIRSYLISNPSRVSRLGISSGTTGDTETTFYLNTTTETASMITLESNATFYLKMEVGGNQAVPVLRTYNSGK